MKGKRPATEQKIRILREADGGKSIVEVCKEHNISEVTFDRWKRQFGQLDVNEAKRMKELERENAERPHSSLGYLSPQRFVAEKSLPIPSSGTDRQAGPSLRLGLPTTTAVITLTNAAD